jgi:hypothetical protein
MLERSPKSTKAEQRRARDRRLRARRKAGRACYLVEIDGAILDLLLRTGWASEAELSDARAVGTAITRLLAASART